MDNDADYHAEYPADSDYDYESGGEDSDGGANDSGGDDTHDKYYYCDGISLPLPLNTFMRELYGDVIRSATPSLPHKETSGKYDQLFLSSINSGHTTRVLVGDNENTVAVNVKCTMGNLTRATSLQHALCILTTSVGKDVTAGVYLVHSGMEIEVVECEGDECSGWYTPLSVAESKLSSELGGVEIKVPGSSSNLPTEPREQKVTHGIVGIMDRNTLVTMFPGPDNGR